MALRIGGGKPALPEQEPAAEEMPPALPEEMPEEMPDEMAQDMQEAPIGGGRLNPMIAGYRDPEMGPFTCANCIHFSSTEPNTCDIVSGYIDEAAVCNNFTSAGQSGEQEMPEEAPEQPEEPAEEPLPEEQPAE